VAWQKAVPDAPVDRVQVLEANDPPEPPSLQVTVPDGGVGDVLVSVTVAVKVIEFPAVAEEGLGDTLVAVGWRAGPVTVRDDVPELAACVESPE